MVNVEEVVVTKSGKVPSMLIEQVPTGLFGFIMIFPVEGLTVIKGAIGDAEYVHVLERVPQFTLAKNGVMFN